MAILPTLDITAEPGKRLVIVANDALRQHLAEECTAWDDREMAVCELLRERGLDLAGGDRLFVGLTSAPVIHDGSTRWCSKARMDVFDGPANVWWFSNYAITDWTETLRDAGRVEFDWGFANEAEPEATAA
jgi:hypothetical protein